MRAGSGRKKSRRSRSSKWIKSKEEDLKKGWAYFRDQKITLKTEVTQYQGCISFVFMTSRLCSRYLIAGNGNAIDWLIFSALTFFFGWWGFPWGLIFTPQALYRNLRRGYSQPVNQLLAKVDEKLQKLTNAKRNKLSTILKEAKAEARA